MRRRGRTSDKDKEGGIFCLDLEMQGGSECAWAERRGEEIVAYVAFVAVTRESFYADDLGMEKEISKGDHLLLPDISGGSS